MKNVIITVVIILAIVIVGGLIYVYTHKDQLVNQIMEKSLSSLQTTVMQNLQTEEKKEEVKAIFEKLGAKIKAGSIDKSELQDLGMTLKDSYADKKLDEKETEIIIQKLKKMVEE